jgi:hypothetical protein
MSILMAIRFFYAPPTQNCLPGFLSIGYPGKSEFILQMTAAGVQIVLA